VRPREPRRNVMIAARMRHGNAWCDANILNISSRGLLLHATTPPSRGTYIEVRRGTHVIVGRVIWAKANRFGVYAQDRLAIDPIVADASPDRRSANDVGDGRAERRARPRPERMEWRYSQSREKGRALQFACISGFSILLAACAYEAVTETLSRPLSRVSMQFGAGP
jgi:hypothetical protein